MFKGVGPKETQYVDAPNHEDLEERLLSEGVVSHMTVSEVREAAIEEKGGLCVGCECRPSFFVKNSNGCPVSDGNSYSHQLRVDELAIRVDCDAHNGAPRRPAKGRVCQAKKRFLGRNGGSVS